MHEGKAVRAYLKDQGVDMTQAALGLGFSNRSSLYYNLKAERLDGGFKALLKEKLNIPFDDVQRFAQSSEVNDAGEAYVHTRPTGDQLRRDKAFGKTEQSGMVPYYENEFVAGSGIAFYEGNSEAPAYYIKMPGFEGCIAFPSYGDSMTPLVKGGNVLFGRKVEDWREVIEYGKIYGIVLNDQRRLLKYIRKADDPKTHFLLVSENAAKYDAFEIPKDKIKNIWLIEGWMIKDN